MNKLLKQLAEFSQQPFDQALTAPPAVYSSAEIYELEQQRIFASEWQCVGRAAEISEIGDYISAEIGGTSIIVVRQKDGSIKALSNICQHRCSKLLKGSGCVSSIVCPYHAWAYRLDGQLIGTRHMEQTDGFDTSIVRLPAIRCELWHGFIYVTLDEQALPVATLLQNFDAVLAPYQLDNYVHAYTYEERWPANWKCFVENYLDAYHVFKVHKNTFGVFGNFESATRMFDGGEQFTYHLIEGDEAFDYRANPADGVAHPNNIGLTGALRAQTVLAAIFPNQTMQLQPDLLWYVLVQPDGADHLKLRWSVSIAPEIMKDEAQGKKFVEDSRKLLVAVNAEDEVVIPGVYAGTKDPNAARSCYSHLERNVFRFGCYLAAKIC